MSRRPAGPGRRGRPSAGTRHPSSRPSPAQVPYSRRPFEGWPGEADLVAMREVVPSATAPLTLVDGDRSVLLATVLPMSWAAMVRADGSIVLGLQTSQRSGDLAVDLGQALAQALEHSSSAGITNLPLPDAETPSLRDLVVEQPLQVTVHEGFDWWLGDETELDEDVTASMQEANASVVPTVRLTSVDAAYWCKIGDRCHLRWAVTEDEDKVLEAMARLHVKRALPLGDGAPYIGSFRAQGILVPVWDLPGEMEAEAAEKPAADFWQRLGDALAETTPLTGEDRRAKAGVASRQVTLRQGLR